MGSVSIEISLCEKMGNVRKLGILLVLFSLWKQPTAKGFVYFWFGLNWPSYGYVVPQNMLYYLCIRTYLHVYVLTVLCYLHVRMYFIHMYVYCYTTYMYVFIYIHTYLYYISIHIVIIHSYVHVPICTYVYPLVTTY